MTMRRNQTQIHHKSGVTLVELIIVLGISTMLMGGVFAWFNSRRSVDFLNQVRQIESQIRSVQSESVSNRAPNGATTIASGEELFGTAVGIAPEALATPQTTLRVFYLKQLAPGPTGQSEGVDEYGAVENIALPSTIYLAGYRIIAPNDPVCPQKTKPRTSGVSVTSPTQQSLIVFRQNRASYNAFSWPDSTNIPPRLTTGFRPTWSGSISGQPGWRGSYDDESYNYTSVTAGPLASQPCAVLWLFDSVERNGANPRFTAEIQFNLLDGTTTVQTR